jgi:uncharacterized protein YgiM (DUF1202 family)
MKRLIIPLALLAGFLLAGAAGAGEDMMSIQVKSGSLRETPSYLGKIVAPVGYGDRVAVVSEQGEWRQVRTPSGATGWIHSSALTEKKVVLSSAGQTGTSASGDELALAGKGFNAQVEGEFKKNNQDVDFSWVDKMEKIKIAGKEIVAFLQEGQVAPGGGK